MIWNTPKTIHCRNELRSYTDYLLAEDNKAAAAPLAYLVFLLTRCWLSNFCRLKLSNTETEDDTQPNARSAHNDDDDEEPFI